MSASHLKPDIEAFTGYVGFVPMADIAQRQFRPLDLVNCPRAASVLIGDKRVATP